MKIHIAALLCLVTAGATARASAPQSDVAAAKEELVTIAGCVQGSRLKASRDGVPDSVTRILHASEYVLDGQKEILKRLRKDHDGHFEEITGLLKLQPSVVGQPDVHVRTKDLGPKTRITIGDSRETGSVASPPPAPPRIFVHSFKHIAEKCAAR